MTNHVYLAANAKNLCLFSKPRDNNYAQFCDLVTAAVGDEFEGPRGSRLVVIERSNKEKHSLVTFAIKGGVFFHPNGDQQVVVVHYNHHKDDASFLKWPKAKERFPYQGISFSWKILANPGLCEMRD